MADQQGVVVGIAPSETGTVETGVGYAATGLLLCNGVEVCRAQSFAEGDVIGVYLDMNKQQVAFFREDEAQLDPDTERVEPVAAAGGTDASQSQEADRMNAGLELELETKAPVNAVQSKSIAWLSFQARAVFAAVTLSSNEDRLVVYDAELPEGYR
ncbi:hypothetical protein BBJ28_00001233 [Nothophytophthora sp. Chile5]|nr:hypothetical protein BBJ28_00001233 [Nothophytophthora sp. Chile5]